MARIKARAPGKVLWLGGYAVLERPCKGFSTTVNSYVNIDLTTLDSNEVLIEVPQFGDSCRGELDPKSGVLSMATSKELMLIKTATEVATKYLAAMGAKLKGMRITSFNDQAMEYELDRQNKHVSKSGLGSSAAVTASTIGAILRAHGVDLMENDALHKLSQIAHSVATGKIGSGYDISAAVFGSNVYTRFSPDIINSLPKDLSGADIVAVVRRKWDYAVERLTMPALFKSLMASFVGEAAITTSLVSKVFEFRESDPDLYASIVKKIDDTNNEAIEAMKLIERGDDVSENLELFEQAFDKSANLTKALGVLSKAEIEDDELTRLIEASKKNGAHVSKLPGSGGKDAIAAIAISEGDWIRLRDFWSRMQQLRLINASVVNTGFECSLVNGS